MKLSQPSLFSIKSNLESDDWEKRKNALCSIQELPSIDGEDKTLEFHADFEVTVLPLLLKQVEIEFLMTHFFLTFFS